MKIAGFVKNSLIDYPGKITSIVFTQGCNFRCPFCHNPDLLDPKGHVSIAEQTVLDYLEKRKGLVEALTVTGGEPLMQKDLRGFLEKVKSLNLKVKLDTNGSSPVLLERLLQTGLVDYVAMDLKTTLTQYEEITGFKNHDQIQKSIECIMKSGLDYEFRTTVLPRFHTKEIFEKMGRDIKGAKKYFIQNFRPDITLAKEFSQEKSFSSANLLEIKKIMDKHVLSSEIREND